MQCCESRGHEYAKDDDGCTPVHYAERGDEDIAVVEKMLLEIFREYRCLLLNAVE